MLHAKDLIKPDPTGLWNGEGICVLGLATLPASRAGHCGLELEAGAEPIQQTSPPSAITLNVAAATWAGAPRPTRHSFAMAGR